MSTKYFKNVTTIEELKGQYKKLAFQHHPDRGGDIAVMQIINAEYAELTNKLKDEKNTAEELNMYKEIINDLITIDELVIEIVGTWLWVSGNTKPHKEILKQHKFSWNKKRELWQRKPVGQEWKPSRKSNKSVIELKEYFGSELVKGPKKGPHKPELN